MNSNRSHNAVIFLLITIFLDSVGIGILIPVIPELIRELANVDISKAAIFGGLITALFSVVQFFFKALRGNGGACRLDGSACA